MAVRPTQGSKLFFLTGNQRAGLPGTSALSNLAHPPASALAGEARALAEAQAKGLNSGTGTAMQVLRYVNRDYVRELQIHQSIKHAT